MEAEIFKMLMSGGGGAALVGLLFYIWTRAEAAEKFERERYISRLEATVKRYEDMEQETERPTRPVRMPASKSK